MSAVGNFLSSRRAFAAGLFAVMAVSAGNAMAGGNAPCDSLAEHPTVTRAAMASICDANDEAASVLNDIKGHIRVLLDPAEALGKPDETFSSIDEARNVLYSSRNGIQSAVVDAQHMEPSLQTKQVRAFGSFSSALNAKAEIALSDLEGSVLAGDYDRIVHSVEKLEDLAMGMNDPMHYLKSEMEARSTSPRI